MRTYQYREVETDVDRSYAADEYVFRRKDRYDDGLHWARQS